MPASASELDGIEYLGRISLCAFLQKIWRTPTARPLLSWIERCSPETVLRWFY